MTVTKPKPVNEGQKWNGGPLPFYLPHYRKLAAIRKDTVTGHFMTELCDEIDRLNKLVAPLE